MFLYLSLYIYIYDNDNIVIVIMMIVLIILAIVLIIVKGEEQRGHYSEANKQMTATAVIKPATIFPWWFMGFAWPLYCFLDLGSRQYV